MRRLREAVLERQQQQQMLLLLRRGKGGALGKPEFKTRLNIGQLEEEEKAESAGANGQDLPSDPAESMVSWWKGRTKRSTRGTSNRVHFLEC